MSSSTDKLRSLCWRSARDLSSLPAHNRHARADERHDDFRRWSQERSVFSSSTSRDVPGACGSRSRMVQYGFHRVAVEVAAVLRPHPRRCRDVLHFLRHSPQRTLQRGQVHPDIARDRICRWLPWWTPRRRAGHTIRGDHQRSDRRSLFLALLWVIRRIECHAEERLRNKWSATMQRKGVQGKHKRQL